jgi:seryl-tRNA synthetase
MPAAEKKEKYVPMSVAVAETGASRGTILRWVKEKPPPIRTEQNNAGARTYCLEDLIARAREDEEDETFEELDEAREVRVSSHLTKALAQSQKHVENLLEPARQVTKMLGEENELLRKRCSELEAKLVSQVELQERMVNAEHERKLAEEKARAEQARLDQLMSTLMQFAPAAFAGVASHFGLAPMQEGVLTQAVLNLTDEQFAAIARSGALPLEAIAAIERIRTVKKSPNGTAQTPH